MNKQRCHWVTEDPLYIDYHDNEWGVPLYDNQQLFAMLNLEGQQAGLRWITVLKKRMNYHTYFFHFNPKKIVQIKEQEIQKLLQDPGLIRNRLKLNAIIKNAYAYLNLQKSKIDFSEFLWGFVENQPMVLIKNKKLQTLARERSIAMSKALKQYGFTFVGPTICYAFMQAVGMINEHDPDCDFSKSFYFLHSI
ncbi:MAG: DNA-3-methyladenine glycosylase I [Gammaproteobacteria bacterium]|nr:DNA-3-methyladenine glycosylase I [Gammaproteobacteria bacterium]